MRHVEDAINDNIAGNHGKELIKLSVLKTLLGILQKRNLSIDFLSSQAWQCVTTLCESTLVSDNIY
jgi:hypothetical protein